MMKFDDRADRVRKHRIKKRSRKKDRFERKLRKNKLNFSTIFKYLFLILVVFGLYLGINLSTSYFNKDEKLNIAVYTSGGDINFVTLDPKRGEISSIIIPGDTEVDVARGLGRWRIKSIKKLSEEEGLGGLLITETLTHNLAMPVYVWAGNEAQGLVGSDIIGVVRAILFPYKTNLGVGDRIKIALFNLSVNIKNRQRLNLAETSYLRETTLDDGSRGYVVVGRFPVELLTILSDEVISHNSLNVTITDYSGEGVVSSKLSDVIETLGAKVASISKEKSKDIDCEVSGNKLMVKKMIYLFGCKEVEGKSGDVFDVNIEIGETFAKRY